MYYKKLIITALLLSVAVMLPDFIVGLFGVSTTDMPMWAKVINVFYILGATIYILYRYGVEQRDAKNFEPAVGYPYGTAFARMMMVVIVSSVPVAGLTFVLRNYISIQMGEGVSLFGLWASSLMSIIVLGGMGALISAAYVKRNPIANS